MSSNLKEAIEDIVSKYRVGSQKRLLKLLDEGGHETPSQATVSRLLSEMGVIKQDGYYTCLTKEEKKRNEFYGTLWQGLIKNIPEKHAQFYIKTETGSSTILGKMIKERYPDEVLGCIAGEDILQVIVVNQSENARIMKELKDLSDEMK
ncbi:MULTISPECIES: hypothetical protein [unclassified Paenibacillus]|uniref:hypothetical protein n=1 Tax=unclassified Paenibacillus TaxID=185978 RepID=UPI003837EAAF